MARVERRLAVTSRETGGRQGRQQTGQTGQTGQTVGSALEAVAAASRHGQSNSPAASSRAQGVQAGEHDGAGARSCRTVGSRAVEAVEQATYCCCCEVCHMPERGRKVLCSSRHVPSYAHLCLPSALPRRLPRIAPLSTLCCCCCCCCYLLSTPFPWPCRMTAR
jgi:hypothetical protein